MFIYLHLFFNQEELEISTFDLYQSNQSPGKSIYYLMLPLDFNFFLEDAEFWSKERVKLQL